MSIERNLSKLLPRQNKQQNNLGLPPGGVSAPAEFASGGSPEDDNILLDQGQMRHHGPASLDTGNDYGGLPQASQEIRGAVETAIDYYAVYGVTSGNISLNIANATSYYLYLTGPTVISIDYSDFPIEAYSRRFGVGVDVSVSVVISKNGAFPVSVVADMYAPNNEQPDLNAAGMFEIGISVMVIGENTITRMYPCIVTKPAGT